MGQYTIKDIESRTEVLKNDIDNIYRALNTKVGNSPGTLDQVPGWILDIPTPEPLTEEPLKIIPTTDIQEFYSSDNTKYNPIIVEPVTSAIDSNIQPENIKAGISILGVFGTLSGGESNDFLVPTGMKFAYSTFTNFPTNCDTSYVTDMNRMFYSCSNLTTIPELNTSNVTNMSSTFEGCSSLTSIPQLNTSRATNMSYMFNGCTNLTTIPELNTSNVTNMDGMFSGCGQLTTIPELNTTNVTNMSSTFDSCSNLTTIPQLNTSRATNMSYMFNGCTNLTTIPELNTSNVTNMDGMFSGCGQLTTIPELNTTNVENMDGMFSSCNSLTTIPLLNTSKVTNMNNMFNGCYELTEIPQLDTSKVTSMSKMFGSCYKLTTIPQLNTSNVEFMEGMFMECTALTTFSQLDTSKAKYMGDMLSGCVSLTSVEGINFSGLEEPLYNLFGWADMSKLTRFIVNGKINVSIPASNNFDLLTSIGTDSIKSILEAADRTDNTNEKELAFNVTAYEQNGEISTLVASCASKGWTITGLTIEQI